MKSLILFLVILCSAFMATAQNWRPFSSGQEVRYYSHSDSTHITNVIHVDSIEVSGMDTTYHLNRMIKVCDTCTVIPNQAMNGFLYHGYAPEFLNYETQYHSPSNSYLLNGDTLYYSANLLDTWDFDISITATVTAINEQSIFGTLDSVKTINLSNSEIILLSKNHGLLRYPVEGSPGKYYELLGIQKMDINQGDYLPNVWSTYDFQVNDKFSFKRDQLIVDDGEYHQIDMQITQDLQNTNEFKFAIHALDAIHYIHDQAWPPWNMWWGYYNGENTSRIIKSTSAIENTIGGIHFAQPPGMWDDSTSFFGFPLTNNTVSVLVSDTAGVQPWELFTIGATWRFDSNFGYVKHINYYTHYQDSLFYITDWTTYSMQFANNLGRIKSSVFDFEYYNSEELMAYDISSGSWGTPYNHPIDLGIEDDEKEFAFYPNPSSGSIQFNPSIERVVIYNIDGKLVGSFTGLGNHLETNLKDGLYIIEAMDNNGKRFSSKLIVHRK